MAAAANRRGRPQQQLQQQRTVPTAYEATENYMLHKARKYCEFINHYLGCTGRVVIESVGGQVINMNDNYLLTLLRNGRVYMIAIYKGRVYVSDQYNFIGSRDQEAFEVRQIIRNWFHVEELDIIVNRIPLNAIGRMNLASALIMIELIKQIYYGVEELSTVVGASDYMSRLDRVL